MSAAWGGLLDLIVLVGYLLTLLVRQFLAQWKSSKPGEVQKDVTTCL